MIKDGSGSQRFYGVYRAVVFDNKDPNALGRLRLTVPQIFSDVPTGWSWPTSPAGVRTISPEIGQGIWVMFEGGDPSFPMWIGVFGNEVSDDTTVALKPISKGTIIPHNITITSNTDGSNSVDLVKSLIRVASVIDGGSA